MKPHVLGKLFAAGAALECRWRGRWGKAEGGVGVLVIVLATEVKRTVNLKIWRRPDRVFWRLLLRVALNARCLA